MALCQRSEGGRKQNNGEGAYGGGLDRIKVKEEWRLDMTDQRGRCSKLNGKLGQSQQDGPPALFLAERSLSVA